MIKIERYNLSKIESWNTFIKSAKSSTFLFNRNFMDYHSHRFVDQSLMIYDDSNLVCCFPANSNSSNEIVSHGGLTYGGFILQKDTKLPLVLEIIKEILKYYENEGFERIIYKAFPRIYNQIPSDEIEYAFFILKAELYRRDTAIVINQSQKINYSGNIRRESNNALKKGYIIEESNDFSFFWNEILSPNLLSRFGVNPVHSLEEIVLLKSRFPDNIRLYLAKDGFNHIQSGTVFFLSANVAHCQYIASTDEGRKAGGLNLLFTTLIDETLVGYHYFDFGIVNENNGRYINRGMLGWKERMGGRTISHDFYKVDINNWIYLEELLQND